MGATAVLVGRAYAYGLAGAGLQGVSRAIEILRADLVRTLGLLGCASTKELTGKYVEVPLVAIINFRGDKLYHEHIYWDQASVLVQIGLLDPKLLPAAGRENAQKVLDETRPSNTLMKRWVESANAE